MTDDVKKLLDNKRVVILYRNGLGSYTAVALHPDSVEESRVREVIVEGEEGTFENGEWTDGDFVLTDDFEPSKALHRLTEKVFKTGDYAKQTT